LCVKTAENIPLAGGV